MMKQRPKMKVTTPVNGKPTSKRVIDSDKKDESIKKKVEQGEYTI